VTVAIQRFFSGAQTVRNVLRAMAGGRAMLVLPLLWGLLPGPVLAQPADSAEWRPVQVGFSAAGLVSILEGPDAPENYQIYGRVRATRHWTARAAVRYEHLLSDEQEIETAARVGLDYVLRDDGRLQLYAGLDAVGGYDRFRNDDRTYRLGGAPVFGMLLFVTDYLSLSVEPRLVATYAYFDNRGGNSANADEWSVDLKGDSLLIVSVHF
jgi:hypothetical protein